MNKIVSAGLLMYSIRNKKLKLFLVHPGGPFFVRKDEGYWSIPKGLPEQNENILDTAKREFNEETGLQAKGKFIPLDSVVQKSGKQVFAWAFENEMMRFLK